MYENTCFNAVQNNTSLKLIYNPDATRPLF